VTLDGACIPPEAEAAGDGVLVGAQPGLEDRSAGSPVARAAVIHDSRSLRRLFMMAAKARTLAASWGDAVRMASRVALSWSSSRSGLVMI
jgi:hypothetical protein